MLDQILIGEANTPDEIEEYFEEYDKDWYIGLETDDEWKSAVLSSRKQLFSIGHNKAPSLCRRCKIVWKSDRKSHPVTATVYKIDLMSFMFVCLMAFNATFNNISVISWQSVLSEDPEKTTNLSQVTYKLYHSKVL
jgi:hypothetical protein